MGESQSLSNFCEGGCRTDRTARDDANGPEQRPPVRPRPAHGTGSSPSLISTHKASMIVTNLSHSPAHAGFLGVSAFPLFTGSFCPAIGWSGSEVYLPRRAARRVPIDVSMACSQ